MYTRFAAHTISTVEDLPFDPAQYSRFKYGDGAVARAFGSELAQAFLASHRSLLHQYDEVVLVPSPYDSIPTASYALSEAFRTGINSALYEAGRKSLLQSKIHRYKTYTVDYGQLSAEDRLRLIESDTYHLDRDFLANRLVLFLDDIRITGSHELIIRRQIEVKALPGHFVFLYYAMLDNEDIAPDFENFLNYYSIHDMAGVCALLQAGDYRMNTRVIKYILKSEAAGLRTFLQSAPPAVVRELADYAIGNNYHLLPEYRHNLHQIVQHLSYGH